MFAKNKSRSIAVILALSGALTISGLHKFYLGQPLRGVLYVLLSWTPIPKVACAIEAVWYLAQDEETFDRNFNSGKSAKSTLTNKASGVIKRYFHISCKAALTSFLATRGRSCPLAHPGDKQHCYCLP